MGVMAGAAIPAAVVVAAVPGRGRHAVPRPQVHQGGAAPGGCPAADTPQGTGSARRRLSLPTGDHVELRAPDADGHQREPAGRVRRCAAGVLRALAPPAAGAGRRPGAVRHPAVDPGARHLQHARARARRAAGVLHAAAHFPSGPRLARRTGRDRSHPPSLGGGARRSQRAVGPGVGAPARYSRQPAVLRRGQADRVELSQLAARQRRAVRRPARRAPRLCRPGRRGVCCRGRGRSRPGVARPALARVRGGRITGAS